MIGDHAVRELRRLVARYGAGEAEVARVYFEERRTPAHDRVWLTSQVGRELSRVYSARVPRATPTPRRCRSWPRS
jgi:hypothetical protein